MQRTTRWSLALAILFLSSAPGGRNVGAQPAPQPPLPTTRAHVQAVLLKPDMVNEWIDLQRNEVIPAQKKAGVTSRLTLATAVGESFEYLIITPFPSWAAMDADAPLVRALGADGAARLNAKLRKCILVQQTYMTNRQDSLSIPAGDALVWRQVVRQFSPGKQAEYLAFYRSDILPAMQKAKAQGKIVGSTVSVRGAGGMSGEFVETTHYARFADIDSGAPLTVALGAEAAAKLNTKGATLATTKQVIVRRRLADLSF